MTRPRLALTLALLALAGAAAWYLGWDRPGDAASGTARVARPAGAAPLTVAPEATPPLEVAPPVDGGGLEVRVTLDGAPQPGAAVRAYLHRPLEPGTGRPGWRLLASATTGPSGVVLLPAAPGAYLVSARVAGLAPALEEVVRPTGEPLTRVALPLARPVTLSGRTVERGGGEPVPAAALVLSREPERGPRRGELPAEERRFATSDGLGRFELGELAPGRYLLEAEAAGHARARVGDVALPRGGPLEVVLSAAGLVEGQVVDSAGRPAEGAEVAFTGGDQVLLVTSGPSGGFAAEVPPRSYRVSARRGEAAAALPAPLAVAAGQVVRQLLLRLGTASAVQGVVVTSAGDPIPGAAVGLSPAGEGGELGRATTGADGRFAFRGLAPGDYDLDGGADGFAPALRRGLSVPPGETFEVTLTLHGTGVVVGTVSDGEGRPVAGARLRGGKLWGSMGQVDAEAVTGADGAYRLSGLEPGRTTVRARREEALAGAARLVVVEEGRATRADFTLPGTGTIEGTVRTASGATPGGPQRIAIFGAGGGRGGGIGSGRGPEAVTTDASGRFGASVPEGSWRLVAFPAEDGPRGQPGAPVVVEVRAGEVARADLVVADPDPATDGGTLTVEVREPGGEPSPGATVLTQRQGAPRTSTFQADAAGRIALPLVSGEAAKAPLSVGARNGGRFAPLAPVAPGSPLQVVQLLPAASLRGEVREAGRPVPGAKLALETGGDLPGPGQELQRELSAAAFTFADLLPGQASLTATTPDGRTGALELALQPGGDATAVVEVARGATVSGRVVDQAGAPVAGAFVLVGDRELGGEGTATDGRFRLEAVTPGAQALRAFLPRHGSVNRSLELTAGQELDVGDLVLVPGDRSHGH